MAHSKTCLQLRACPKFAQSICHKFARIGLFYEQLQMRCMAYMYENILVIRVSWCRNCTLIYGSLGENKIF